MSFNHQKGSDNNNSNTKRPKSHIKPRSYKSHHTTAVHKGYMAHRSHMNNMMPSSASLPHSSTTSNRLTPHHNSRSSPSNDDDRRRRSKLRAQRAQRNRHQRVIEVFDNAMFDLNDLRFDITQVTISNNGRTITVSSFTAFDPKEPDEICSSDIMQTRGEFAAKLLRFAQIIKNERLDEQS
eukprot:18494_1